MAGRVVEDRKSGCQIVIMCVAPIKPLCNTVARTTVREMHR